MHKRNVSIIIVTKKNIFKKNVLNLLKITRKLIQLTIFKKVLKQTFQKYYYYVFLLKRFLII